MKALDQPETRQDLLEQLIVAISRLARPAESQIAYWRPSGQAQRLTNWPWSWTTSPRPYSGLRICSRSNSRVSFARSMIGSGR